MKQVFVSKTQPYTVTWNGANGARGKLTITRTAEQTTVAKVAWDKKGPAWNVAIVCVPETEGNAFARWLFTILSQASGQPVFALDKV